MWQRNLLTRPSTAHLRVEKAIVDQEDLLYIGARSTAKTVLTDEVGSVHQLLKFVDDSILMLQGTDPLGKAISEQVRNQFVMNRDLAAVFPEFDMSDPSKQGDVRSWNVPCRRIQTKEGSFDIGTPGSSRTGSHYDVILASDLMNPETTPPPCGRASMELMKEVIAWYAQSLGLLKTKAVNPRAHRRNDTNRWTDNDLAGELIRRGARNTMCVVESVVKRGDDGRFVSAWPGVITSEELHKIHDDPSMTEAMWAANYMADPLPEGGMAFRKEWIHLYGRNVAQCQCGKRHGEPRAIDNAITVDPAFSDSKTDKKRTDRSAMIAAGPSEVGGTGGIYVDAARAGRWTPNEFNENLFEMIGSCSPSWVGIEETGSSRGLIAMFENELARTKRLVLYRELKPGGRSKQSRMVALHHIAQKYGIFVRPGMEELVEELLRFGVAEHDDLADALAYRAMEMQYMPHLFVADEREPLRFVPPPPPETGATMWADLKKRQRARLGPSWARRSG